MAERRRADRHQFLHTYIPARHITEMDQWVTAHPHATSAETADAFEQIITTALRAGAHVSNHLSDHARDISIPAGGIRFSIECVNDCMSLADTFSMSAARWEVHTGMSIIESSGF
jgi:hypothetical protein